MFQRLLTIINSGPDALASLTETFPKYWASEVKLAKESAAYELDTLRAVFIRAVIVIALLFFTLTAFTVGFVLYLGELFSQLSPGLVVLGVAAFTGVCAFICFWSLISTSKQLGGTLKILGRFSRGL